MLSGVHSRLITYSWYTEDSGANQLSVTAESSVTDISKPVGGCRAKITNSHISTSQCRRARENVLNYSVVLEKERF